MRLARAEAERKKSRKAPVQGCRVVQDPELQPVRLQARKLILSKVGEIPIKLHRKIKGEVKGVIIKRERSGKWFAKYFQVEDEPGLLPKTEGAIGIDCWDQAFPDGQRREAGREPEVLREDA